MPLRLIPGHAALTGMSLCYVASEGLKNLVNGATLTATGEVTTEVSANNGKTQLVLDIDEMLSGAMTAPAGSSGDFGLIAVFEQIGSGNPGFQCLIANNTSVETPRQVFIGHHGGNGWLVMVRGQRFFGGAVNGEGVRRYGLGLTVSPTPASSTHLQRVNGADISGLTYADGFTPNSDGSSMTAVNIGRNPWEDWDSQNWRIQFLAVYPATRPSDANLRAWADDPFALLEEDVGTPVPVLSAPTAGTPGTTTITIGATSDRASDGTMRFLRRVGGSAADGPTIASTGESQAATANPQSRAMSAFTAGSANNYVDMVQVGAGGNSNVVTAGPFTMASAAATAVTLSGPSGGVNGVASTNFTAGANGVISGSLVVTPSAGGGGGTFSPTSVTLTSGSPTATFTYTPASTGAKSITVTNNGGLSNPSAITYTVTAGALSITTDPLLDKDGAARIGYTVSKVYATRLSDDVQVKVWTNVVTNGTGRLVLTDAALTAADHLISSYTAGGVKPAGAKVYLPA